MRRDAPDEVGLGLIGHHLEQVGEELAFGGELDDGVWSELSDRHSAGQRSASGFQCFDLQHGGPQGVAELAVGDLEAADGGPLPLGVVDHGAAVLGVQPRESLGAGLAELVGEGLAPGIGYVALRVIGLDGVVDEGVEGVLLAEVLEEVLLSPALEHAEGDLGGRQVAT